jgi:quinol monooxygenase YgiN
MILIAYATLLCTLFVCFRPANGLSARVGTRLMMSSSTPDAKRPFALNVKMSIRPEKREAWLKQIKDDQVCTRKDEVGNLQFALSEDIETPNTFYLHEQYVDESAFDAHVQSPHFVRYDEFCKAENPFSPEEEPEVHFFSPLEEGDDWADGKRTVPKSAFCVTVNLYPKADVREEFLKVIANNKRGTDETEPLALQYTFGESTAEPNTFHFHEQYSGSEDGKEGFDAHASSPHFADWESFVDTEPFAQSPEVYFSKIIED